MSRSLTAEMLVDLLIPAEVWRQFSSGPAVSPDGRWVVSSFMPSTASEEHPMATIWIADTSGTQPPRPLTSGMASDVSPKWSPDGSRLAFLSDREKRGTFQLQMLPLDGGEAQSMTDELGGIATFDWLPGDQPRIAYLTPDQRHPEEEERRGKERDDAKVYGEFWNTARLRVLDVDSKESRLVAHGEGHITAIAPAPDGRRIALVISATPDPDDTVRDGRLDVIDIESGESMTILEHGAVFQTMVWTREGDALFYAGRGGKVPISSQQLWRVDVAPGATPWCVSEGVPFCFMTLERPADRDAILALVAHGVDTDIYEIDPSSNDLQHRSHFAGDLSGLTASADGTTIATLGSPPDRPFDIYAGRPTGALKPLTTFHSVLDNVDLGAQEVLTWERAGYTLDGILIWPPGTSRDDGPLPTVVSTHGGPYGRWPNAFISSRSLIFGRWAAAQGYLVFLPNPRGGMGHGQAFAESVVDTVGNEDYLDVMAGVDRVVELGLADPDRLAIDGWSQGGFMAAWAIGHTDRFKAAIVGAGPTDWGMMIATSDVPTFQSRLGGGNPYTGVGPHAFDAQSPISFVSRATTPTLILHGEEDVRVPVSQAIFLHRGLRQHNVPAELVIYPREPHRIRERQHNLDMLRRVAEWYARWL